jgi:protein gp37
MNNYFSNTKIPNNVWLGVTVDVSNSKDRIDYIKNLKSPVKFISCEPLLEDLGTINLKGINWVIVGGESGNKARPMKEQWVNNIKIQTTEQDVLFFFKQWGTWGSDGIKRNKKANGKALNGQIIQEMPFI